MSKPKIVVTVHGGLISGVYSDTPANVLIVDFDLGECEDGWQERLGWEDSSDLNNSQQVGTELGEILIDVGDAPE